VVIAAIISSFCGQIFTDWWSQRRTRNETRQLLLAEIRTLSELDVAVTEYRKNELIEEEVAVLHSHISTSTFETLEAEIGCLSSEEIEAVREYYSVAEIATKKLEKIRGKEGDTTALRASFADRTLPQLRDRRRTAEQTIIVRMNKTTSFIPL
jgi:hypothetical protein